MELGVTLPPVDEIPDDGDMRSPEGSSARYNTENGYARVLRVGGDRWEKIDDPIGSGQKARDTMEVLMAIYESARKRKRIDLPLKTLANPLKLMVDSGELPVEWPGAYEARARIVRDEGMARE